MISVVCPIYNEIKYIENCIQSILSQDYPQNNLEVLFVDGMSFDGTRDIIMKYSAQYPFIKLVDNLQRIVPVAMNIGIRKSIGNVIIRLDAHALYPSNYISVLVKELDRLNADNVGVACRTDVMNKTSKTLAIKEVLSNRFGVGNSIFRLGVDEVLEVDTVPFGCWRRDVFDKYGYYNTRLIRNQDIELNKRIIRGGGHIYIVPDTYCTYLARETYLGLCRNNYSNGKWNILTVYYTKQVDSLSIRHFIPLLFVLSLLIPILLSPISLLIVYVTLFSLSLYLVVLGSISLLICVKKKINFFYLLTAFGILHLSYGWGSFLGLLRLLMKKV
ncbi:glycosyltransferase family 2 protein [Bacteroides nordii]|jgi:glycosyltransferase involved in cell wall biosynthesis|uniref:glycosyltransferase family 2 protein n=1 Tax=Bacteroides nordii TaxID=291645 RepID=UPI00189FBB8E|nr:glycosyltransferase family 2 protein [Bacteroides nordii]MCE8464360.1 glycosyltransferase family 2 protein [Bacteroides nordii]UYU50573.1 glycosyltransferase family 2 protein [Bacteroides nordii]